MFLGDTFFLESRVTIRLVVSWLYGGRDVFLAKNHALVGLRAR